MSPLSPPLLLSAVLVGLTSSLWPREAAWLDFSARETQADPNPPAAPSPNNSGHVGTAIGTALAFESVYDQGFSPTVTVAVTGEAQRGTKPWPDLSVLPDLSVAHALPPHTDGAIPAGAVLQYEWLGSYSLQAVDAGRPVYSKTGGRLLWFCVPPGCISVPADACTLLGPVYLPNCWPSAGRGAAEDARWQLAARCMHLQLHHLPRAGGEMQTWNVGWRGYAGVLVARDTAATPQAVLTWLRWSGTGYTRLSSVRVVAGEAGRIYASAMEGDMQGQVAQAPCRILLVAPLVEPHFSFLAVSPKCATQGLKVCPVYYVEPHRELRCQKRLINGRRAYRSSPPGDSSDVTLLWFNNITGSWILSSRRVFIGLQWMSDHTWPGPWHLSALGDASLSPTLVKVWTGLDSDEQSSWYATAGLRFVSGAERAKHREAWLGIVASEFIRLKISTCNNEARDYWYGLIEAGGIHPGAERATMPSHASRCLAAASYLVRDCEPLPKQSVPDAVVGLSAVDIFRAELSFWSALLVAIDTTVAGLQIFALHLLGVVMVTAPSCRRCSPLAVAILAATVNAILAAAACMSPRDGFIINLVALPLILLSALSGFKIAYNLAKVDEAAALAAAANAPPPQDGVRQAPAPQTFWPPNLHVESIPPSAPVPPAFCCPITMAAMANPAITPRGTSYDREALCDWITKRHRYPGGEARSPKRATAWRARCDSARAYMRSQGPGTLELDQIAPNYALRQLMEAWIAGHTA